MAGAIYFAACGGARWGRAIAVAWLLGVTAMFVLWPPLWRPFIDVIFFNMGSALMSHPVLVFDFLAGRPRLPRDSSSPRCSSLSGSGAGL
jgi:hypothetical protein